MADLPMETISINVTSNAADAAKGLEDLSAALRSLSSLSKKLEKINKVNVDIQRLTTMLQGIAGAMNGFSGSVSVGFSMLVSKLQALARVKFNNIYAIATSIRNLNLAIRAIPEDKLRLMTEFLQAARRFPAGTNPVNGVTPPANPAAPLSGSTTKDEVGDTGEKAREEISKTDTAAREAAEATQARLANIKSALVGLTRPLTNIIRMLKMRLMRAFISNFMKDMSQGIQNVYDWSKKMGTQLATDFNTIQTATNYLSNAFGAMAGSLLQTLTPAIDWLIDKIVEAINWLNKMFAALGGKSSYTTAIKKATKWGESVTTAAKATKEALGLLKIDELNQLPDPDKGNSSGGSTQTGVYDFVQNQMDVSTMEHLKEIAIAIGAVIAGWKLWPLLSSLGVALPTVVGCLAAIWGFLTFIDDFLDMWNGNIDFENLSESFTSATVAVAGLGIAFGWVLAAITSGLIGFAYLFLAIKEFNETGKVTEELLSAIHTGFTFIAVAAGVLFGWVGVLVVAIADLVAQIALGWDESKSIFQNIKDGFVNWVNQIIDQINWLLEAINKIIGTDWKISKIKTEVETGNVGRTGTFASGGFPTEGQLFIAREAGAELVGNINGKTAVANNDQIVQGISAGVQNANQDVVTAVYAMANQIVDAVRSSNTQVTLDGRVVSRSVTQYQNNASKIYG